MKTREFIDLLRAAAERELQFENEEGDRVPGGYHLTEIKAVAYETVDCGGQGNRWKETILQLWVPEDAEDHYMKAGKFVRIFDSVRSAVALDEDGEVRIEYGDAKFFPSVYHVSSVSRDENALRVVLQPPGTTCKARDRRADNTESNCCA